MNFMYKSFLLLNVLSIKATVSSLIDLKSVSRTTNDNASVYNNCYTSIQDQLNEDAKNFCFQTVVSDTVNDKVQQTPWYLAVPLLPILFATSPTLLNGKCKRQVQEFLKELDNGALWAVRMFDSSTKYPEGILSGHTRHYGNFDECHQMTTVHDREVIAGKYCSVEIGYRRMNVSHDDKPFTLDFDPNRAAWEAIEEKGDFRRIRRYLLQLALCVPDTCTETDVERALKEPLRQMGLEQGMAVTTAVKGECQVQSDSVEFSKWARIYCLRQGLVFLSCAILGLFLMVAVGTWYDRSSVEVNKKKSESLARDIFQCFSVKRNYASIVENTYGHQGLDCIELFRVIIMVGAVFGHRLMQFWGNPTINFNLIEKGFTVPSLLIIYNGTIIVEIFFTIGGILRAYNMLRDLDKKKEMNLIPSIVNRYLRFTPPYFIVIVFVAVIFPQLGSGPYWKSKVNLESGSCAKNWWINVLYMNNYVNTDELCILQSWYIAVDFHLYILSSFVIYFIWKIPRKIGYLILIAIICGGSFISFYLSYFQNVPPMFKLHPYIYEMKEDFYFKGHYIKTHERLTTYFVGVLGGTIIYYHSLSPWKIPMPWKHFPFVPSAFILCTASIFMGFNFFDPNVIVTPLEKALYATFSRLTMAVGVVVGCVYMSVNDESEISHKLFKPRWVQPLAKLTYGVFLIHGVFQIYDIGVARNARTYSTYSTVRELVADLVYSFFLAFILKLVVEEPFRKLAKFLTASK